MQIKWIGGTKLKQPKIGDYLWVFKFSDCNDISEPERAVVTGCDGYNICLCDCERGYYSYHSGFRSNDKRSFVYQHYAFTTKEEAVMRYNNILRSRIKNAKYMVDSAIASYAEICRHKEV